MDKQVLDFLSLHRVSSLSVMLPSGYPHAAALHYSHSESPLKLFFSTENTSYKCQGLLDGEKVKASVVIGFSEEEWKTIQMDGEVRIISDKSELASVQERHYAKHPNSAKFKDDPATVFLEFVPSWTRYTDYNTDPVTIIEK